MGSSPRSRVSSAAAHARAPVPGAEGAASRVFDAAGEPAHARALPVDPADGVVDDADLKR
jgi:hypothetical protein